MFDEKKQKQSAKYQVESPTRESAFPRRPNRGRRRFHRLHRLPRRRRQRRVRGGATNGGGHFRVTITVVVGHSSGAVAAMRLAEKTKLKGIMLVATYDSDMSDANERKSGYFTRDFDWKAIKSNCEFVCCVGGTLDDLVPIQTQRRVAMNCLGLVPNVPKKEWLELPNEDHFFTPPCSELVALLERNVDAVVGSCER